MYYQFHPLHGLELDVVRKSRKGDGAVTVVDPEGISLKIPLWMVSPQATEYELSENAEISVRALLELVHLLEPFFKE